MNHPDFSGFPPHRAAYRADRAKGRPVILGLFGNGIFLNPMGTKMSISLARTDEEIERMFDISRDVLKEIS